MEQDLYILIGKKLAGELTPEEDAHFQELLSSDNEALHAWQECQQVWEEPREAQPELDMDLAWSAVAETISDPPRKVIPLRRNQVLRWVAAAILLISFGVWWNTDQQNATELLVFNTGPDERKELLLPDNSTIWLNQNSSVSYPKMFSHRQVTLQGEAFFSITRDPENPFVITAGETLTTVLGTSFNLRAYAEEEAVELTVTSGKVQFESEKAPEELLLVKGEQARFETNRPLIEKIFKPSTKNIDSWISRKLVFDKTPLAVVAETIERYYGVPINIANDNLKPCLFTGTFEDPALDNLLEVIAYSLKLEVNVSQSGPVRFDGQGCH